MSKIDNNVMEKCSRSHGKKSDKETHTPMLKIFKDMIQLEKNDPEKANLLKDKERNKKRKQYSSSRSKSDIINRSCDSCSSDRHRASQVVDNRDYDVQCSQMCNPAPKCSRKSSSSGSGISCALKRLATSEYFCISCLGILFAITVLVAFFVVFKSAPSCAVKKDDVRKRPGRMIFGRGRDFGEAGLKEGVEDRNDWDDSRLGRFSDGMTDFDDPASRGLSGVLSNQFTDLSRIIDVNKLNYGKSSERLKSFYKKLLQTDDQIKNLKKGIAATSYGNMKAPDRKKRSVRHHNFHTNNINRRNDKNKRNKRYPNYSAPTGFVIEKKKIMVHLPNEKRIVPKCSHSPKDQINPSKSHETELKHPFYKHSQRLDELLDQFLDRNLPQFFGDLNLESLFQTTKKTTRHTTRKTITADSTRKKGHTNLNIVSDGFEASTPNDFFSITSSDKSDGEVILGVTTVMSPAKTLQNALPTKTLLERVPNIRKLMQAYEDDEDNLGYEDLKEVLADDAESHDDTEVKADRNKRSYDTEPNLLDFAKSNPPGVQIPNWKGPLPLYPDELNTMIKSRTEESKPVIIKDSNDGNVMFTDVEYVEDYFSNKYDKLANMAQAYSDYGVLDEKKENKNDDPKPESSDSRAKLTLNIPKLHRKLVDRFKKGTTSSSMFFSPPEMKETFNVPKFLKKHIKIVPCPKMAVAGKSNLLDTRDKFQFGDRDAEKEVSKFKSDLEKEQLAMPEKHTFVPSQKHIRMDRSPNVTDSEIGKRSFKDAGTTAVTVKVGDFLSLDVGLDDKLFSNPNETLKVDYGLENNDNTNILVVTTTPTTDRITPRINKDYIFMHRSLKSIEENDQDKVIGIDEDITMEELMTTELIEESNKTSSKFITIPAKGSEDTTIADFEIDKPIEEDTTDKNLFNTIAKRNTSPGSMEPDIVDYVTVLNTIQAFTRQEPANQMNLSDVSLNTEAQKNIINIVNMVNSVNNTKKVNDGIDLSDFFRMISVWFSSLASASLDDNNDDNSSTANPIMNLQYKQSSNVTPGIVVTDSNRSDLHYPNYDSDMIDNIGHRSRVLMSVDEVSNVTEGKKKMVGDMGSVTKEKKRETALQHGNMTEIPETQVLTTTIDDKDATIEGDKNALGNKTVAKRSIGDSGLVFWSDLYDDEYGIKIDPIEKELAGKIGNRGKEFMKRSRNWFQDKVRSIADNIKGFRNEGDKSILNYEMNRIPKFKNVYKRQTAAVAVEKNDNRKAEVKINNFDELTERMRTVVKEAAKAVQQTRKMQVRENKDDSVANGIMQQLVRMMSDLVNFQVQQKTCVKLPPDLQNFLEWITSPNKDDKESHQVNLPDNSLDSSKIFEKEKELDPSLLIQDKTECLETLHAVQDLMQQYDQMDDVDKSKMSGVRQYLENQLEFLNNQLSRMDEFNYANIYANQPTARFRRHLTTQTTPELNRNIIKRRIKRRLRKFIKNFGKKHTKRTNNSDNTKAFASGKLNDKTKKVHDKIKEEKVKKQDKNLKVKENDGKVHKSKPDERKDNIKGFKGDFAPLNDDNKEFDKVLPHNYDLNNLYRSNDEFEQNDLFNKGDSGVSYKDDKADNNEDLVKRNLQDVYYRALYEAKKVTTMKSHEKSDSSL